MIKRCTLLDHTGWLPLRLALWPDCATDNEQDKQTLLSAPERYLVQTFTDDSSEALGFAEASIRTDYVNGSHSSPVAFLEGCMYGPPIEARALHGSLWRAFSCGLARWAAQSWLRMHCWITRQVTPCMRPWASSRPSGWFIS